MRLGEVYWAIGFTNAAMSAYIALPQDNIHKTTARDTGTPRQIAPRGPQGCVWGKAAAASTTAVAVCAAAAVSDSHSHSREWHDPFKLDENIYISNITISTTKHDSYY